MSLFKVMGSGLIITGEAMKAGLFSAFILNPIERRIRNVVRETSGKTVERRSVRSFLKTYRGIQKTGIEEALKQGMLEAERQLDRTLQCSVSIVPEHLLKAFSKRIIHEKFKNNFALHPTHKPPNQHMQEGLILAFAEVAAEDLIAKIAKQACAQMDEKYIDKGTGELKGGVGVFGLRAIVLKDHFNWGDGISSRPIILDNASKEIENFTESSILRDHRELTEISVKTLKLRLAKASSDDLAKHLEFSRKLAYLPNEFIDDPARSSVLCLHLEYTFLASDQENTWTILN